MSRYLQNGIAVAFVVCLLSIYGMTQAQGEKALEPRLVNGDSHEASILALDDIAAAAGEDKLIIMIARLGTKEFSRSLSQRRLQTARFYLRYSRSIQEKRIVIAEGERVKGKGRVEVYIDGKLYSIFVMVRNKDFAPEP